MVIGIIPLVLFGLICETNNFNRHRDSTLKPVLRGHSKIDKNKGLTDKW